MPTVLKSGSLNLLEPSGPVQACNGSALYNWLEPENRIIMHFFYSFVHVMYFDDLSFMSDGDGECGYY